MEDVAGCFADGEPRGCPEAVSAPQRLILGQQCRRFLALGTGLLEETCSVDWGLGWGLGFRMIQTSVQSKYLTHAVQGRLSWNSYTAARPPLM